MQKRHRIRVYFLRFIGGRQNLLNTDLIDKVLAFQVGQMRPFFVVCKVITNPLRHCKDETAIIHVQPEAATDKLTVGVACERAIGLTSKVGFVKSGKKYARN